MAVIEGKIFILIRHHLKTVCWDEKIALSVSDIAFWGSAFPVKKYQTSRTNFLCNQFSEMSLSFCVPF
jgi:hypothetical protein